MRTFYPETFDSNWWLLRIKSPALGFYYTIDNRELENNHTTRKLPKVAIRLGFLIENFFM